MGMYPNIGIVAFIEYPADLTTVALQLTSLLKSNIVTKACILAAHT